MTEHYEAQSEFANMLYVGLAIPWWHPFKKIGAYRKAFAFRDTHKKCCEWAREDID